MTKTYSPDEHHKRMMKMAEPSKKHSDAKEDRGLVQKMVKKNALTGRADGGMAPMMPGKPSKKEGKGGKGPKVMVNVIAPRGGGDRAGMPMPPVAAPGPASVMPSRPPVPVAIPRPPMAPPGGLGAMGPMPAGAKRGGKVQAKAKKRASGGGVDKMGKDIANVTKPKTMKGYDAGAGSGDGRLEKEKHYGVKAKTRVDYNTK